MSIWHPPHPHRTHPPAHPLTLQDLAIYAGGLLLAAFVGIAATGGLPLS